MLWEYANLSFVYFFFVYACCTKPSYNLITVERQLCAVNVAEKLLYHNLNILYT